MSTNFIIDFDSTFITTESLEELARISLEQNPDKDKILSRITRITNQGMEGKIPFHESLQKRLKLLTITPEVIARTTESIRYQITPSIQRNRRFFELYKDQIYIISGGFEEIILPIVRDFGIEESHVLANKFKYSSNGTISGADQSIALIKAKGKVEAVNALKLSGTTYVIGDGYTDYEIKKDGAADSFIAFTENTKRSSITKHADKVVKNFDELLFYLHLPRTFSYPKSKMKVLLLENIHQNAVEAFKREGYRVEFEKKALSEEELAERIKDVSVIGIRSKTQITSKVLKSAKKLLSIGAFCIGTNQIDLTAAAQQGVAVFNAPYSNTRSVVELIIGEIIMLARGVCDRSKKLHDGEWDKSATGSFEIRGKKLGIIGYGNIGSQLSVIAENLGMDVYFYDIVDKLALGNATKCSSLEELLRSVDVVTVHVDGRASNNNLIGSNEFTQMKDGMLFLNASRGFVVDLKALKKAIKNKKVQGAAVDVFPKEPKSNGNGFTSELQKLSNVILTPHIGGSTEEAQSNIGNFVSNRVIQFINSGSTTLSVNFPHIQLSEVKDAHRLIHIHKNMPGILAQINSILAKYNVNILGQYLKTNEEVGYVITDVNKIYSEDIVRELKQIEETIRVRALY